MRKTSPWQIWKLNFELLMSVMHEVEPRVREHGLEMKEFFLLGELDEHPNPADLARAMLTPKPTVTFMVKRMEAAGYLRREMQPDDLRRFRLTLTPSGRKAMEASREILDEAFGERLARLTQAQRTELIRALERMAEG
ncbi:MarR family winged helix-turn-helix transcriptional regulator [Pendulispora albinea]|uniref:MarR family transcriptional regulator n=1 Tax=Pendulispora albinea TaxID=2741071 RepID=A0ABZ2LYN4_9BACT